MGPHNAIETAGESAAEDARPASVDPRPGATSTARHRRSDGSSPARLFAALRPEIDGLARTAGSPQIALGSRVRELLAPLLDAFYIDPERAPKSFLRFLLDTLPAEARDVLLRNDPRERALRGAICYEWGTVYRAGEKGRMDGYGDSCPPRAERARPG